MKVYHGSILCVDRPLAYVCRDNLDFGKGFYVTDLYEQAVTWANRVAAIHKKDAYLNLYDLDVETVRQTYNVLRFESYNQEWLDFIIANRRGETSCRNYDLIEGGVANDRVFNTIELYFAGLIPNEEALKRLSYEKPNWQFCLANQTLIDKHLHFNEAFKLK